MLRILYLDDGLAFADTVRAWLAEAGVRADITHVRDLAQFGEAIQHCKLDLILADYLLPTCTGIQALQLARQSCPEAPFLLVSGSMGDEAVAKDSGIGVMEFIPKEHPERLVPAVQRALRKSGQLNFPAALKPLELQVHRTMLSGHGETVLVVDDEHAICRVVKKTLENFGYKVLTAGDGKQALATYVTNQEKIAAALVDLWMPVMDGAATIRALRHINPHLRIIAGSGLGDESRHNTLAGLDVSHFLSKPYTLEILLQKLCEVLAEATEPSALKPSPVPSARPPP